MAMAKVWREINERLDRIETALQQLTHREPVEATLEVGFDLTKEELMKIKGVGSSTADEILELLNS